MNSVLGLLAWLSTILGGPAPCDQPRIHRGEDAPVLCLPPPPSSNGSGSVGGVRGGQAVTDINNGL